jgi:hypothetical protein
MRIRRKRRKMYRLSNPAKFMAISGNFEYAMPLFEIADQHFRAISDARVRARGNAMWRDTLCKDWEKAKREEQNKK